MTSNYKIKFSDVDEKGGVERLEGMGHDRVSIHDAIYKMTDGISTNERTELVSKLYKRNPETRHGKPPKRWI